MNITKRNRRWLLASLLLTLTIVLGAVAPHALAQGTTQRIEMVGTIQAVNPGLITVNGLLVNVSGAEVETALSVGRLVKVEGFLFDDGILRAYEVTAAETDDDRDQFEMVGVLEASASGQMTIAGIVFDVANAEMTQGLVVGDLVKVHANRSTTGQWMAREVKRFVPGGDDSDDLVDDRDDDQDDQDDLDDMDDMDDDDVASPVTACAFGIEVSSANLRTGPGTGYDVQGYALRNEMYPVVGVHSSGAWLQVMTANQTQAWIAASVGELEGTCSGLSVSTERFRDDDSGNDSSDDLNDDHGNDDSSDDLNNDHGSDDGSDDLNNDHGSDDSSDDLNDDHGSDDSSDDLNDDHGSDDSSDD